MQLAPGARTVSHPTPLAQRLRGHPIVEARRRVTQWLSTSSQRWPGTTWNWKAVTVVPPSWAAHGFQDVKHKAGAAPRFLAF